MFSKSCVVKLVVVWLEIQCCPCVSPFENSVAVMLGRQFALTLTSEWILGQMFFTFLATESTRMPPYREPPASMRVFLTFSHFLEGCSLSEILLRRRMLCFVGSSPFVCCFLPGPCRRKSDPKRSWFWMPPGRCRARLMGLPRSRSRKR